MDVRRLTDSLAVAPQLSVEDVREAARLGFRTLVNNRPDGEEPAQPSSLELEAAAHAAGLQYFYQPVNGSAIGEDDVHDFASLFERAQAPVLAFCRSGARSVMLWALNQPLQIGTEQILAEVTRAGYELSSLRLLLEAQRRGSTARVTGP